MNLFPVLRVRLEKAAKHCVCHSILYFCSTPCPYFIPSGTSPRRYGALFLVDHDNLVIALESQRFELPPANKSHQFRVLWLVGPFTARHSWVRGRSKPSRQEAAVDLPWPQLTRAADISINISIFIDIKLNIINQIKINYQIVIYGNSGKKFKIWRWKKKKNSAISQLKGDFKTTCCWSLSV